MMQLDSEKPPLKKIEPRVCVLFFLVFALSRVGIFALETDTEKRNRLEAAYHEMDKAYPKSRYFRSGASLISGFFRCKTARDMLNRENPGGYEKFAAYSLLGFSSLRFLDGIKGIFFKSSIEKSLLRFRRLGHQEKIMYGREILRKIAKYAKRDRLYHSFLRGASGGIYLYLYFKDKDKTKKHLYSGLVYVGFAALNLFSRSTPEKAWKSYKEKTFRTEKPDTPNTQFYIAPAPNGFKTGFLMTF